VFAWCSVDIGWLCCVVGRSMLAEGLVQKRPRLEEHVDPRMESSSACSFHLLLRCEVVRWKVTLVPGAEAIHLERRRRHRRIRALLETGDLVLDT